MGLMIDEYDFYHKYQSCYNCGNTDDLNSILVDSCWDLECNCKDKIVCRKCNTKGGVLDLMRAWLNSDPSENIEVTIVVRPEQTELRFMSYQKKSPLVLKESVFVDIKNGMIKYTMPPDGEIKRHYDVKELVELINKYL